MGKDKIKEQTIFRTRHEGFIRNAKRTHAQSLALARGKDIV